MAMGLCSSARFVCGDIFVVITKLDEWRAPSEERAARAARLPRAARLARNERPAACV
jgi:hypothetical protein